jgi:hypothetical protein
LDACRNNPFGGRGLRDMSRGLAVMPVPRGTLISYATQPGNVASDGDQGGDSPYTLALAQAMRVPGIDVLEMFNDVGLTVDQSTHGVQQPWLASSPIEGKFYFAGKPSEQMSTKSTPVDPDGLMWQSVMGSSNPADFQTYLDHYPQGAYATLAQSRIAAFNQPPPNPTAQRSAAPLSQREMVEANVMFPPNAKLAIPSGAQTDKFLGEWYGRSAINGITRAVNGQLVGREIIFAIQSVYGDRIIALSALGGLSGAPAIGDQGAQAMQRTGHLNGNQIEFDEPGRPRMVVKLRSDGELEIDTANGNGTSIAFVRRFEQ